MTTVYVVWGESGEGWDEMRAIFSTEEKANAWIVSKLPTWEELYVKPYELDGAQ